MGNRSEDLLERQDNEGQERMTSAQRTWNIENEIAVGFGSYVIDPTDIGSWNHMGLPYLTEERKISQWNVTFVERLRWERPDEGWI